MCRKEGDGNLFLGGDSAASGTKLIDIERRAVGRMCLVCIDGRMIRNHTGRLFLYCLI